MSHALRRVRSGRLLASASLSVLLSLGTPAAFAQASAGAGASKSAVRLGAEAVLRALSLLGVPYRWGGSEPETGLDCSGLVQYVYGELGLDVPRHTSALSQTGDRVGSSGLQPGDLVFFNTLRRAFSHVGIYVGNGKFVHAPSSGSQVRVESMNARYWRSRFDGARRIVPEPLQARLGTPLAGPAAGSASSSADNEPQSPACCTPTIAARSRPRTFAGMIWQIQDGSPYSY